MMISAFAKGAQILGRAALRSKPRGDARNFLASASVARGRFDACCAVIATASGHRGFLDDYACLINALVDLYETAFDPADLTWAAQLAERAIELFEDRRRRRILQHCRANQSDLVLRLKDDYDGAEPSGNSVMALALLRLARMTGRDDFRDGSRAHARSVLGTHARGRLGIAADAGGAMFAMGKPMEIVLAGPRDQQSAMLAEIRKRFLPNAVVMQASEAPQRHAAVDGAHCLRLRELRMQAARHRDAAALAELLQ